MSTMLPERWKEPMKRVSDKIGHFLEKLVPRKESSGQPEHMTADVLPAFMQFGGPLFEMNESANELLISVEIPGLKKDDVSVEIVGRRLTIRGKKQITRERKEGDGSYFSESRFGGFIRSVKLPYDVDERSINADLKHGVLTIRLPRPDSERNRRHRVPVS